ncbi:thiamine pyrophosphate-binding protein [Pricia sp. S334]|uniref:Thiamine pyrophosphate-binding protein n=1 Tax=Pricia mediterranea TaxID=3076079 RepID=A0ABU3L0S1_9FLAO|nr:thiamine pyrophosphate-binding protein [Pricia sp. S334]MDT7827331.1 thiamine pyrophosphate-binding protein [Pricia sp. S334]
MANQITVGTYLTTRLEQLGVNHLFAVPGDYTSDFLEIVDQQSTIERIGNCNELNAGYAADGYARANGLGAMAVTTGVGAFSALNAIGGAYVEKIPVVLIIGTLSNTKLLQEMNEAELYHHQVNDTDFNKTVFKEVTVAFERISNPMAAPAQIDAVITACISQSRPAALEIMEDCYYMPCPAPEGTLAPVASYESFAVLQQMAATEPPNKYAAQIVKAVNDSADAIYGQLVASKRPILLAGKDIGTQRLQSKFQQLLDAIQAPFATSLLGKSVIAENNAWYIGQWDNVFTQPYTASIADSNDCLIGLGVWNTDLNNFGPPNVTPNDAAPIFASREMVKVGGKQYAQVSLENLMDALIERIRTKGYNPVWNQPPGNPPMPAIPSPTDVITYDHFFDVMSNYLRPEHILVSEIGLSTFGGSSFLKTKRQNGYLGQNIWASIGWSVPAGLGASFTPDSRTIVTVGDGAFKLTCQAISTMVMEKRNTVVFVFNNKVYAVEQILLDPKPFETGSNAPFEAANVLQQWDYVSLMNAFSNNDTSAGKSANVNTVADLQQILASIDQNPNAAWLVNINLNERDYPIAWKRFVPGS